MEYLSPESYWLESIEPAHRYPSLAADSHVDVAIIGAGITGLTAALYLKQAGKRVAVLEAGRVGSGTSCGTTGHLDCHPEQGFTELLRDFGADAATELVAARRAAIDQIEAWTQQFHIDCDFVRVPAYLYTLKPDGMKALADQVEAARQIGQPAALTHNVPLPWTCRAALQLPNQARFHAMRYLLGLARQIHDPSGKSATIYEQSRVEEPPEDESGNGWALGTRQAVLRADAVIVATHSAFLGISTFDARVAPYQSYVVTAELEGEIGDALFWDDESPYHYIRRADSQHRNRFVIGGKDHKTGQADETESFQQLEDYVRSQFRVQAIGPRWSAELFEPSDGVPYIGQVPRSEHLYVATGYSGTGLTWGTAAGRLLANLVLGIADPLADIVTPRRLKPLAAGPDLLKENLNVAKRYVVDRFQAERVESLEDVGTNEGKVVEYQGELIALYRDADGSVHAHSAKCTHAGCIVQWNSAEKTWDCPCHGGRYNAQGERIYGPPPRDLPVFSQTPVRR